MDVALLDFDLPADRIAQEPAARREAARLLVIDRSHDALLDASFRDIGQHLRAGDLLVLNDTRVIASRIRGRKESGGAVEVTLLDPDGGHRWALVRSSSRTRLGQRFSFPGGMVLEVTELSDQGPVRLAVREGDLEATLSEHGQMPLPPYIRRPADSENSARWSRLDRERYQTVVAAKTGAVAAPTAGLHFTQDILDDLGERGIGHASVTLHVGYGSFQPIRTERVEDHKLHSERFEIRPEAAERIDAARAAGGRIVAVGTTVARSLETAVDAAGRVAAGRGSTDLMILPGHRFRAVDALLTNFHFPRTTLLALAFAFGGIELVRRAYAHALEAGYRFLSYGDATLIV